MARRIYTPERIVNKLREAEVLLSQVSKVSESARKIRVQSGKATSCLYVVVVISPVSLSL